MYPQALQNNGSHNDYHLFITFCYNSIQFFLHNSQFCLKKTDCSLYKHNKDSEMFTIYHILSMASSVVKQDEVTKFCLETELGLPVVYKKKKRNWNSLSFFHEASYSRWLDIGLLLLFCFVLLTSLFWVWLWTGTTCSPTNTNKTKVSWPILNHLINQLPIWYHTVIKPGNLTVQLSQPMAIILHTSCKFYYI